MMTVQELKTLSINDITDRTFRQQVAAGRWKHANEFGGYKRGVGTIYADTGFGKTTLTIEQIVKPFITKWQTAKVIILVHREFLEKQWYNKLEEAGIDVKNITVVTVQYLIAHECYKVFCDLLIIDELHQFYGDDWSRFVTGECIKYTFALGLTASPYYDDNRHTTVLDKLPIIDIILRKECIEKGWVANYIEYNLGVKFNDKEHEEYAKYIDIYEKCLSKFGKDGFRGANAVSKGEYGAKAGQKVFFTGAIWAEYFANINGWTEIKGNDHPFSPKMFKAYSANLFKAIRKKEELLYTAEAKYKATIELFKHHPVKTMVFSQSTEFADNLKVLADRELGETASILFHSNLPTQPLKDEKGNWIMLKGDKTKKKYFGKASLKTIFLDRFKRNVSRILITAKLLDEYYDQKDIRFGIITSRSSNNNQQNQRKGRIIRIIPENPTEVMIVVNIYIKGTEDEYRLAKVQKDNEINPIWIEDVNQISLDGNKGFNLDI